MSKKIKNPFLKLILSQKLTVVCLVCLSLLTFWGTLYQAQFGLYEAQEKFFRSWIVMLGYVPFPGAIAVLWILSVNLIGNVIFVFRLTARKSGIFIMHWGMLILLVGGGLTFYFAEESQLLLDEGGWSNTSVSLDEWELSIWTEEGNTKKVTAISQEALGSRSEIVIENLGVTLRIKDFFGNAIAYASTPDNIKHMGITSVSNIVEIEKKKPESEVEVNRPGLDVKWITATDTVHTLLYGGEQVPNELPCSLGTCKVQIRRKHYVLPFSVKLKDFVKTDHTNTSMAKSYESSAEVTEGDVIRDVRIFMNNPFRSQGYTLFQASFSQQGEGESSTFAVVKNPGRLVPYISSVVSGVGLALHFIIVSFFRRKKKA